MAPSSSKKTLKPLFLVMMIMCSLSCGKCNYVEAESEFVKSVRLTIDTLQVISMISRFGVFGDFRLSNAVTDCLDLMELSIDLLSWTISVSQNPNVKDSSIGNLGDDLKTWLSRALTNHAIVRNLLAGSLGQVTSLAYDILKMVKRTPPTNSGSNNEGKNRSSGCRKLISCGNLTRWLKSWFPTDRGTDSTFTVTLHYSGTVADVTLVLLRV